MNLLFVYTINRMRSCTAEAIYSADTRYMVMSAGAALNATQRATADLLLWADKIFVMGKHLEAFILGQFTHEVSGKQIIVLGIPDMYYFMQPELVDLLKAKITPWLE
jgi:predicted protein tyrosine phosphatase